MGKLLPPAADLQIYEGPPPRKSEDTSRGGQILRAEAGRLYCPLWPECELCRRYEEFQWSLYSYVEALAKFVISDICPNKQLSDIVEFDKCCDVLKKYHITATFMTMNANYDDNEMTTGECEALFKILKPTGVTLNSQGSNRFEALSQAKQLVSFS